jgi:lipopolysaccharide transport system permease protein
MLQQLFAYGLGFVLAVLNVFLRDLKEFVSVSLQLWFWLTPIVYTFDILPDYASQFLQMNPAYLFIAAYHDIVVFDSTPSAQNLIILLSAGLALCSLGYYLCGKLERDIRDFL